MHINFHRHALLALMFVALAMLSFPGHPTFAQDTSPRQKAGSHLSAPASNSVVLRTDRLIITPHFTRGGKLSAQLANHEHGRLAAMANLALSVERELSGRSHLIRLAQSMTIAEARALSAKLRASGEIESAEPDLLMQADGSEFGNLQPSSVQPNDPGYAGVPGQWHYLAPAAANVGGADVPAAWDITLGNGNVTVAVLDTGYRPHGDLRAMLAGYDFVSNAKMGNDGNGRDADARDPGDYVAANECGAGSLAARSSWHGTHVMGTIAALMNNGLYGTGIAPNVRLLPVRVLGKCGGYISDIVDGMRWAVGLSVPGVARNANPARIINLSLGSTGNCSAAFQSAINDVNAAGAIVVVATGNGGYDSVNQPSNCNGALAVTAHAIDGDNADYANIGIQTALSAPGGGCGTLAWGCNPGITADGPAIYSLGNTGASAPVADSYALKRGTSMAAPHVSGTIALMLSLNPTLSRNEVLSMLRASARPFPSTSVCLLSGNEGLCGAGLLDTSAALVSIAPVISIAMPAQVIAPDSVVTLNASASSPGGSNIVSYTWRASSSNPTVVSLLNASTPNASFVAPARGTYQFTLTATDSHGASSSASASVRVNSAPVIQPVANQTVSASSTLKLMLKATDADGDKPVFHAMALPAGASLSAAGALSWVTASPPGSYSVIVAASDNDDSSVPLNFTINVTGTSATSTSGDSSGGGGAIDGDLLLLAAGLLLVRRYRHTGIARQETGAARVPD